MNLFVLVGYLLWVDAAKLVLLPPNPLFVFGDVNIINPMTGIMQILGGLVVDTILSVGGAATVSSTLGVSGTTTLSGPLTLSQTNVSNPLTISFGLSGSAILGSCSADSTTAATAVNGEKLITVRKACIKPSTNALDCLYDFGGMFGAVNGVGTSNPATGANSCPAGYQGQFVAGVFNVDHAVIFCYRPYTGSPALLYGGMYGHTAIYNNVITGSLSCPAGYKANQILGTPNVDHNLFFCYKFPNTETFADVYCFGGAGGDGDPTYKNPATNAVSCTSGYTLQHTFGALTVDCNVKTCYKNSNPSPATRVDYYFKLPSGVTFNTAKNPVSTDSTLNAITTFASKMIPTTGCMFSGVRMACLTAYIVPYNTTTYRILLSSSDSQVVTSDSELALLNNFAGLGDDATRYWVSLMTRGRNTNFLSNQFAHLTSDFFLSLKFYIDD